MNKRKALITGVNGFVGKYLKIHLEENGYVVFGLSQENSNGENWILKCDIRNRQQVFSFIKDNQFDYVFHLAGISPLLLDKSNPALPYEVNVNGTINLLDALSIYSPNSKILIVSSSHVYGDPQYLPIDEKHPLLGVGDYAASRIMQEKESLPYKDRLKLVIVRSFNHTGPNQSDVYIVPKIVSGIVKIGRGVQKNLELGNLNVRREFTDVRDVVRAYRLLLEQENFGIVCNMCRGESVSLQEIINYIKIKSHLASLEVKVVNKFIRPNEPVEIRGDNRLLNKLISWGPLISYYQMLDDIYEFYSKL